MTGRSIRGGGRVTWAGARVPWILWILAATLLSRAVLPRAGIELLAAGPHLALAVSLVVSLRAPREEVPWISLVLGIMESGTAGVALHVSLVVSLAVLLGVSYLGDAFHLAHWRRVTLVGCAAHAVYGFLLAAVSLPGLPGLLDTLAFLPAAGLTGLATAGLWRLAHRLPGLRVARADLAISAKDS